jgi:tRNA1(Val) A37 N6-methylase TrmN6
VKQRRTGYRFSIDALLLAWYSSVVPGSNMLELGAGSGVISLALAHHRPELEISAVEIQAGLAELARQNVTDNDLSNISIHHDDLREFRSSAWFGRYDIVVSNPPYRAVGRGRLNPDEEKAVARHELMTTLEDVIACGSRCLSPNGVMTLILLAEREPDLERVIANHDLALIQRTQIRPYADKPANLLLLLARHIGADTLPDYDFFIWEEKKAYSALVNDILLGRWQNLPHPLAVQNW